MITGTIEQLMAGRTVILITHGRGWAGRADRNVTLDQGRLVLAAGCFGTVPGGRALAAST
jgi:ABC-type transport system involved in cytochrome bd biosynthesis fused ATPase/permease subunit